MVNFGKFQEHQFRKTPTCKRLLLYKFFNNLDETSTYPDEENRELLDKNDIEFRCNDDDSEDEIHHLKNFSLYFRVLFVFLVVLFMIFFARIHFKLKAKNANEVDWFANVIRINRLIFYTS